MNTKIKKYLSGRSNSDEQKELLSWLRKANNLSEFQYVKENWEDEAIYQTMPERSSESWNSVQKQILNKVQYRLAQKSVVLKILRYAAIILFLVSISTIVFYISGNHKQSNLVYTTVKAEPGQIANVLLPDNSEIWLNSGSTIKYNSEYSVTNRNIKLEGEAYIHAAKNNKFPLMVTGTPIHVKVLGTKFNVTSYPDDNLFKVILEEGKVELLEPCSQKALYDLKPHEMAVYNKSLNTIDLKSVNVKLYTSWKDGLINFYKLPLEEVVVKLSKRYNQKIDIDEELKSIRYTYTIKNEPLTDILTIMETITPIEIIQEGDVIHLKYKKE